MKIKPFQTYTLDNDSNTYGYTVAFATEDDAKVWRGGMTGKYVGFTGWTFYPAHAGGEATTHSKYGFQSLEFEYPEDISKISWDVTELVSDSQKHDMIMELFKYYRNKV